MLISRGRRTYIQFHTGATNYGVLLVSNKKGNQKKDEAQRLQLAPPKDAISQLKNPSAAEPPGKTAARGGGGVFWDKRTTKWRPTKKYKRRRKYVQNIALGKECWVELMFPGKKNTAKSQVEKRKWGWGRGTFLKSGENAW